MEREGIPRAAQASTAATTSSGSRDLSSGFKERLSERLSQVENLYFPRALQPSTTTPSQRKTLLLDLISRDVAVFLERYGSQLTFEELRGFDMLRDDYEVNWHLNHIRSIISPTEDELKSRWTKIKNRRRAYLDKLISDGQYFSEDAMREREPYLHHEYVGKFQDPSGSMARPGERWFETLIRRSEEAILVEKIRAEQQRLGVARSDWVGNERDQQEEEEMEEEEEEEEEEEMEEEEEVRKGAGMANGTSNHPEVTACILSLYIFSSVLIMPQK